MSPKTHFWGAFWASILLLAGGYLYLSLKAQARFEVDHRGTLYVSENYFERFKEALPAWLAHSGVAFDEAAEATRALVAGAVADAYAPVYAAIPAFLKLHYSVRGEYLELGLAVFGEAGASLAERTLFQETGFEERLARHLASVRAEADTLLAAALARTRGEAKARFALSEEEDAVLAEALTFTLDDAKARFSSAFAVKGAFAAGAVAAAKAAGKKALGKAAAKLAVKTTGKAALTAAGAGSGATAGLVCGPFAWICAPVAGVAAGTLVWFGTDKLVVEIDEALYGKAFEAELRTLIDASKAEVEARVTDAYLARIAAVQAANAARLRNARSLRERIE